MSFSVHITNSARKSAKKLPQKVKEEIVVLCNEIIAVHPFDSNKLAPPLDMCRSFHFRVDGVSYRIAYVIVENEKRVDVVLIGARENFYDKLRRIVKH